MCHEHRHNVKKSQHLRSKIIKKHHYHYHHRQAKILPRIVCKNLKLSRAYFDLSKNFLENKNTQIINSDIKVILEGIIIYAGYFTFTIS